LWSPNFWALPYSGVDVGGREFQAVPRGASPERTAYRIEGEIDRSKVRLKESRMLWQDERLTSWVPENVAV
jgi:hypothetical protein